MSEYSAADKAALIPDEKWAITLDVLYTLHGAENPHSVRAVEMIKIISQMQYIRDGHKPKVIEPPPGLPIFRDDPAKMRKYAEALDGKPMKMMPGIFNPQIPEKIRQILLNDIQKEMEKAIDPVLPTKGCTIPSYVLGPPQEAKPENPFDVLKQLWKEEK